MNDTANAKPTPQPASSHPGLGFKLAVIKRQLKNFSRYLKFHWESLGPVGATPHGFKILGNRYMLSGAFEPEETALARRCLQDADVFINIGANIGYYCLHALQMGRKTIAFEPIDLNVRHLLFNVKVNGWEKGFELFPVALGDTTGVIEIYGGGTGASLLSGWAGSPAYHFSLCPVARFDDIMGVRLAGKRCFVLVDVEGAEYFMLRGAQALVQQQPRPVWLMEVCERGHNNALNPHFAETFECFWSAGYSAWQVAAQPRRIERDEVLTHEGRPPLNGNFLFVDDSAEPVWLSAS